MKGIGNIEFFEQKIEEELNLNEFSFVVKKLRIFVSNNRSNMDLIVLLDNFLEKAEDYKDNRLIINLEGLKILLLENYMENQEKISQIAIKMEEIAKAELLQEELALTYAYWWFIERIKGNTAKGKWYIDQALSYIQHSNEQDQYITHFVRYSYAIEYWLEKHDFSVVKLLESCLKYYYDNNLIRSLVQTISILSTIYTQSQNGNKIITYSKEIFSNKLIFERLPIDVQGILYYFVGLGFMLNGNLIRAESSFGEAYSILKPIHKKSIYFSNFIILHSYIVTVKALQGKLEQTWGMINDVENLLQEEFFVKNLDSGTKKQIRHTLNLNKFYVYSRLKNFNTMEMQDLITEIFESSKTLYSDFMLLSEFILNANLKPAKLKELLKADNFSLNRVKHLISFVLLGRNVKDISKKNLEKRVEVLSNRETNSKTTFIENVFADLLIAQQLYSLRRFAEISPLLRKYEKQLNRIEVLELRIFMEAFIQIGAYKNGDPLGPALQYVAIKNCRYYGFSRLENKLLNYLDMQAKEAFSM